MTATVEDAGPPHESGPSHESEPSREKRHRCASAYRKANWLLSGAGVTLTLAGVSPHSPEVQAIRRALRALNLASRLEKGRHEKRAFPPGGPRFGQAAG